jgi:protein involved in polysaccharide export with SLBB domain
LVSRCVFDLPAGKMEISIMAAVAIAGGFTGWSRRTRINVHRDVGGKSTVIKSAAKKISTDPKSEDFKIRMGEVIFIPRICI